METGALIIILHGSGRPLQAPNIAKTFKEPGNVERTTSILVATILVRLQHLQTAFGNPARLCIAGSGFSMPAKLGLRLAST